MINSILRKIKSMINKNDFKTNLCGGVNSNATSIDAYLSLMTVGLVNEHLSKT